MGKTGIVGLAKIVADTTQGKVHFCKAVGGGFLFLTVDVDAVDTALLGLDKAALWTNIPPEPQQGSIKTLSLIQARSPEKCIKIAKTAGNKAFFAVFAVFVGVQFVPSVHS